MKLNKLFIYLVIFLMAFSSFSMGTSAAINKNLLDKKTNKKTLVKSFSDQSEVEYDPDEKVRVIVELKDKPAIFSAQSIGKSYSDLSDSVKEKLKVEALNAQEKVKHDIKKASIDMSYQESFTTIVNGFSGEVDYKSLEKIENLANVGKVHISHEYKRPSEQPDMIYSKELVKAQQTWQDYGYKGQGMTVAVIDTGIDPAHKDMVLSDETKPEISSAMVDKLKKEKGLPGKYFTEKVPYAYNYADENDQVLDLGPGASMHGMHVAGTVGANGDEEKGGIMGVAPEAQLLGLKVFGNDPEMPSTYSDIYIKAIDDAIILGADVINMSLGSTAAFVLPDDPEQKAIARAVENGVLMSISAGNSAQFGEGHDSPFAENPDIGVVGSPGLSADSLQVASFENQYLDLGGFNVTVDGEERDAVAFLSASSVDPSTLGEQPYELVDAGLGRMPGDSEVNPNANDFTGLNLEGKVALIQRGESSFVAKTLNAQEKGAIAVIIYNNTGGFVSMATDNSIEIPQLFVLKQYGDEIKGLLDEGKKVEIAFKGEKVKSLNPEAGKMSTFTSWGVTPNLDFKPEITAPGGNILSTLQDNQYGLMSGTSMAAPHVAGGSALVMQRVDKDFKLSGSKRVEMTKNILMNTSKPQMDKGTYNDHYQTGLPYSPRREGSGLMDLHAAMSTPVVITESKSGLGKVALKEIGDKTTFTLNLKNVSKKDVEYVADGTVQTDLVAEGYNTLETQGIFKKDTISEEEPFLGEFPVSFSSSKGMETDKGYTVTVPAGGSVNVDVTVDVSNTIDWFNNASLDTLFENGYFVEGFISFKDPQDTNPELSVPYVGFKGDWDQAPILDNTIYDEKSFYGKTGLVSPVKGADNLYLGTNPVEEEAYENKVAFSPNGDGVQDVVFPALSFLRNAKNVSFSILDSKGTSLLKLRTEKEISKHYYDGGSAEDFTPFSEAKWDGKYKGKVVEDGWYYYEVKSIVDYPDAEWQTKKMKVYVDTKKPSVTSSYDPETGRLIWDADDQGVGVSYVDILVNGKSILEKPFSSRTSEYKLENVDKDATIKVLVYDWAGNVGISAANNGDDDTIPFVTALTPEALSVTKERAVTVEGYVNDDSDVKELLVNDKKVPLKWDAENKRYAFSTTVEFKTDGVQDITFSGTDSKGNQISFKRKVMVDSTLPKLNVKAPYYTNKANATLDLNIADNFKELRFYIDGSEKYYQEFREPYEMKAIQKSLKEEVSLKDGANHFELKLVDMAGNETVKNITIYRTSKQPKSFKDVSSTYWAKDAIQYLNVTGVINGYSNGEFGIDDSITRLQAAQMIVRDLNLSTKNRPDPKLKDVKPGSYGYDVIATIADEGIMTGTLEKMFNPNQTLTRAQMAKILVEGYELEGKSKDSFKDVSNNHWAKEYINTLSVNGITIGYPNNTFKPSDITTRAQFTVFLARTKDDRFK
ncbi:S8 family serine peptidase [Bacillus sp. MCCB 382]|uniref:S8 family serine peptidase n=1 Tax=Bacillus sp. MCCB 382 TaxID=2860197 RepID=UPI001C593CA6|nr:S8 family serine peptidase [Bacillus sp. MCCB 382]